MRNQHYVLYYLYVSGCRCFWSCWRCWRQRRRRRRRRRRWRWRWYGSRWSRRSTKDGRWEGQRQQIDGNTQCQSCYRLKPFPADTKHLYNICTTSAQRLRRLSTIVQMLYKCFVFTGLSWFTIHDHDIRCQRPVSARSGAFVRSSVATVLTLATKFC